jgi:hypothetical protein
MGGWKRLGIVVSVIWMIGAPLYFWHSYDAEARKSADDYYERCTEPFRNESGHLSHAPGVGRLVDREKL